MREIDVNIKDFYIEKPSMNKKKEILDYLFEMKKYNSRINGMGKLDDFVTTEEDHFDQWLLFLKEGETNVFPLREQFICVRKPDDKIIGMINIRKNDDLKNYLYGHIGASIRPLERGKGYGKIELYLALKHLKELGIRRCIIAIKNDNIISQKLVSSFNARYKESKVIDDKLENYYIIDL